MHAGLNFKKQGIKINFHLNIFNISSFRHSYVMDKYIKHTHIYMLHIMAAEKKAVFMHVLAVLLKSILLLWNIYSSQEACFTKKIFIAIIFYWCETKICSYNVRLIS